MTGERRKERRFEQERKSIKQSSQRRAQGAYRDVSPDGQAVLETLPRSEIKNLRGTQSAQLWFPPTRFSGSDAGRTRHTAGFTGAAVLSPK